MVLLLEIIVLENGTEGCSDVGLDGLRARFVLGSTVYLREQFLPRLGSELLESTVNGLFA